MELQHSGYREGVRAPVTPLSQRLHIAVVGAAVLVVALRLPGLARPLFNTDEGTLATLGSAIEGGHDLYIDQVDRKPPLLPYLYAAVFEVTGSTDLRAVRLLMLAALLATAVLLVIEAKRRFHITGQPLVWVAIPLIAFTAFPPEDAQAANFEVLMVLPLTVAFVLGARQRFMWAAVALVVACLCKQTAIVAALPLAYQASRAGGWRLTIRTGALAGGLLVGSAVLMGPDYIRWVFLDGLLYASSGDTPLLATLGRAAAMAALVGLSVAGLAVALPGRALWAKEHRDILLWTISGIIGFALGMRFLAHYAIPLVMPLSLLCIAGFADPTQRVSSRRRLGSVVLLGGVAAFWWTAAWLPQRIHPRLDDYVPIAEELKASSTPDDTLFVWGQMPELYMASELEPAARFPHVQFLTGQSPGTGTVDYEANQRAWSDLWADFSIGPPDLIVDVSMLIPDGGPAAEMSPLDSLLRTGYCRDTATSDMRLYRRLDVWSTTPRAVVPRCRA